MATKDLFKKATDSGRETVLEVISRNPNFFTAFGAIVIMVTGLSIANGKETWWLSGVAIMSIFLIIFIFLNARVLIKATLTFLVTILIANASLQFGFYLSPYSSIGLVWMTSQFFLLFLCLALSYASIGYRSRWTGAIYALLISFATGSFYIAFAPPVAAIPLSVITGLAIFMFYYKYAGKLLVRLSMMPQNVDEERLELNLENQAAIEKWDIRRLETKFFRREPQVSYLAWNKSYAFLIYPVELEQKFGISPRRKGSRLVHRGHSINPWLLLLINKLVPLWRSRNAPIMLVLLDTSNKNGTSPEAIGVSMPDTAKKVPVAIYPGKGIMGHKGNKNMGFFTALETEYSHYSEELLPKHLKALPEIGLEDSSVYMQEENNAPVENVVR